MAGDKLTANEESFCQEVMVCTKCGVSKSRTEFNRLLAAKDKLRSRCKSCALDYQKARHPLYNIFAMMKRRCYNPHRNEYLRYGGRGITVCDEWLDDISVFIRWAKSNGWEESLYIDRIDNDLGYSPDNCRFVTARENNQNTRVSKWWYVRGVRYKSCTDAAKYLDVSGSTVHRWCEGWTQKGVLYPPKENCYSELKYAKTK